MAFKEGDFVEIEYSSWTAADGRMIDTSDQKIAEKNGILVEGRSYGPSLAILGKRTVLKGLDDALMEMNEGQSKKLTLKPDQAFGERNPEMMKVMPLAEFRKRDIAPYPGMRVDIDNIKATVKSVSSGRVVVDANHPYAGLDIIYEVKVLRKLNQEQEKIAALGGVYGCHTHFDQGKRQGHRDGVLGHGQEGRRLLHRKDKACHGHLRILQGRGEGQDRGGVRQAKGGSEKERGGT